METLVYSQSLGELKHNGEVIGTGWAGNHAGKNNPDFQAVHAIGPLPQGEYEIQAPQTHPRLGKLAMYLEPHEDNKMFGRSEFFIHGASKDPGVYGQESKGCIVTFRPVRQKIIDLGLKTLVVGA